MPTEDFCFGWGYSRYALVDKRLSEQYINVDIFRNPKLSCTSTSPIRENKGMTPLTLESSRFAVRDGADLLGLMAFFQLRGESCCYLSSGQGPYSISLALTLGGSSLYNGGKTYAIVWLAKCDTHHANFQRTIGTSNLPFAEA